jgi:GTP pyrophosphokinase
MVRAAKPSSLNRWRDRAAALSPMLVDALDACAGQPLDEAGCADVLDLLDMLG